jgi:NAD(P)-dependent dehydrogenase (short-subunit alcohol dehydrogenase family)
MPDPVLAGRGAIITGGSMGLGYAIAEAFVDAGAGVMICARDSDALEQARAKLAKRAKNGQIVTAEAANIAREEDVSQLVAAAAASLPGIDILVNNAGLLGPIGRFEETDWAEWIRAIEVNLLGSVSTCRAVVPHMRSRGGGKIIQISGGGATAPDPRFSAYAAAKAGIVRFIETIAEELRSDHIDVNSVAPGAVLTRMNDQRIAAGPEKAGEAVWHASVRRREEGANDPALCAALCVFLASPASNGLTGKLISAVRDDWRDLSSRIEVLRTSDVYTLRRITPADRGLGDSSASDGKRRETRKSESDRV